MLMITEYSVEFVKDPFGILPGKRYEFLIDLDLPEDDELYSEHGVYIRAIFSVDESHSRVVKYELFERTTNKYLEFDLEEDEEQWLEQFCKEHLPE